MIEVNEALSRLENSELFQNWKKENKKSYLASFFINLPGQENWQIDFYNPKQDTMISFIVEDDIKIAEESKVFKAKDTKVEELSIRDVKIFFKEANEIVDKLVKESYNNEQINQKIIILQKINMTLWNATCLTNSFSVLNIKIDAKNGDILSDNISSLLAFKSQ